MTKCIIAIKDSNDRNSVANLIESKNSVILDKPTVIPTIIIADVTPGLFKLLEKDDRVSFIEWEEFGSVSVTQNITVGDNRGLDRIDQRSRPLNGKYTYVRSGFNTDIYVFDSGINFNHVEFSGRAFPLFDGVNESEFPNGLDGNGHGTHVSAIIAGNTYGVAKQSKLYSVKVAGSNGRVSSIDIMNGSIAVISDHFSKSSIRHSVANMSLNFSPRNKTVELATESMLDAGIVIVNSAGNNSVDVEGTSPSWIDDVIVVGAIDQLDQYAFFSNYGSKVDVFAPGVNILSAAAFYSESRIVTYESPSTVIIGTVPAGIELKNISGTINEGFDGRVRIRVGFIDPNGSFFSVKSLSTAELSTSGFTFSSPVNVSFNSNVPVVATIETIIPSTKGNLEIEFFLNKLSNSKDIEFSGTSQSCPFASGVVALRLEEEPSKLTTRSEVQSIKQFIIDSSTKNAIKNFSQDAIDAGTPNRILFSPWDRSDVIEWNTPAGSLITLDEGLPLSSIFVDATYYNLIGLETNEIAYSIPNSPTWGGTTTVQINSTTGEITWNGPNPFVQDNEIRSFIVRADSTNPQTSFPGIEREFSITVLDVPNQPPEWINPAKFANAARGYVTTLPGAIENIAYTPFDLQANDPETSTEVNSYSIISGTLPPGLVLDNVTGIISGTPSSGILVSKDYKFVIRATDIIGGVTDRTFSIFLTAQEVSPVWVTPAGTIGIANINSPVLFQLIATDADGDPVFYNLISGNLPSGLTLDTNTGIISGTPIDTPGIFSFTIEATDTVLSSLRTFEIDLQPAFVNNPPTWITPAGSLGSINESSPSPFILQASDVDGDPVTFQLTLLVGESFPPGLLLNSNGTITGVVGAVTADTTYIFTVIISDGVNLPIPRTFSITVLNTTGIVPPVWVTPTGSLGELWEFYPSTFFVEATDTNNLAITYSIVDGALPSGLSLGSTTGLIVGFPDTIDFDTVFTFTIRASNGTFSVDREFSVTILNIVGASVTKVLADRITGFDRRRIREFTTSLFSGPNVNLLYRPGDPEFAIPENFDIYMAAGLPILPPGSPSDADPADEFYRIINDDPRDTNPVAIKFGKELDSNHPVDTTEDRDIGGHHYRSKLLLGDLKVYKGKDRFTGDHLYDVLVVEINDPQAGSSFRPDLVTYDGDPLSGSFGQVTSTTPDTLPDPGVAYPPQYPDVFEHGTPPVGDTHPELISGYDETVLNDENFPTSTNDSSSLAIPRNTESLDFITPHSLENMRQHVINGYGGFVDGFEIIPLWMGSEQEDGDPDSVLGWLPAVPIAFMLPGEGQDLLDSLTTEQLTFFNGYPIIIDRHLVSTTPVLTPTTTFSDPEWPHGTRFSGLRDESCWPDPCTQPVVPCPEIPRSFDDGTTTFDDDNPSPGPNNNPTFFDITKFDDNDTTPDYFCPPASGFGVGNDGFLTTFDINNSPLVDCTFEMDTTTFDGVGIELFNKYIKFPPGDKYWNAMRNTVIQQLKKQMPAIDTKE